MVIEFYVMRNIYNYNTDFDKDTILDKMANIEEQIQDAEDETPSAELDTTLKLNKINNLS